MGKDYRLIVGVKEDGRIIEVEEPERFNAFCSLNTIEEHLRMLTALDKEMLIEDFTDSINCIYEEVYALRAYITGREQ